MRRWGIGITLLLTAAVVVSCGAGGSAGEERTELIVSAAASLAPPLQEIQAMFETDFPETRLLLNYGSSGVLQRQIELGAPADVFLSAGRRQMDELLANGRIEEGLHVTLLTNRLVVIVGANRSRRIDALAGLAEPHWRTISAGEPDTVPVGEYTKEALLNAGLWETLLSKIVFAKDARQALAYVETGNTDAGLVYVTDAAASNKVRVAFEVPADGHAPIEYPIGVVSGTPNRTAAESFYRYLQEEEALAVFARYGFGTPSP